MKLSNLLSVLSKPEKTYPDECFHLLKFKKLNENAVVPRHAYSTDIGLDLKCLDSVELKPGAVTFVETGLAVELPPSYVGLICDRSSLGSKGIKVMGGVIDPGYRGELIVCLYNLGTSTIDLAKHSKVAQMLVMPVLPTATEEVKELSSSDRGKAGFGSSGA